MIALAGVRRRLHLAQQRVHLVALEAAACAHRAVARHRGGDVHQRRSSGSASSHSAMCSARVPHQRLRVDPRRAARASRTPRPRPARTARWRDRISQARRRGAKPLHVGLVELDDLGDQQDLPRHACPLQRRLHALVDDALMRGVLVDDHDAVARLRHDVRLVQLRARRRADGRSGRARPARPPRVRRPSARRYRTPPARPLRNRPTPWRLP